MLNYKTSLSYIYSTKIVFCYTSIIFIVYFIAKSMGHSGLWFGFLAALGVIVVHMCITSWKQSVVPARKITPIPKFSQLTKIRFHGGLGCSVIREKMEDDSFGSKKFAVTIWYLDDEGREKVFSVPYSRIDIEHFRDNIATKLNNRPNLY